jgi:uncharacterized protein (DUF433 family)
MYGFDVLFFKRLMMFDRITRSPEILNGQACIRNLRISVKRVLEILALYDDREELFKEYPELEEQDLKQALEYAAASLEDKIIDLKTA